MPAISLSIGGKPILISSDRPEITDLFTDYFRYYNPEIVSESEGEAGRDEVVIRLDLRLEERFSSKDEFIPAEARLFSKTGVIELWAESDQPGGRYYFDMEVARFMADPARSRIQGLITHQALDYPHILANTYALFPLLLLLRSRAVYHLHAAGVVSPDGKLWLICGAQRAGKTTLTTALSLSGWRPISDDSLLIGFNDEAGKGPALFALKKDFHLSDELFERWHGLNNINRGHHYLGRTCVPGLEFFGSQQLAGNIFRKADYIVLPRITGEAESYLEGIPRGEAMLKLAEQSMFFQLWREHVERHWRLLSELGKGASCLRFNSGRDLLDDPHRAAEILQTAVLT